MRQGVDTDRLAANDFFRTLDPIEAGRIAPLLSEISLRRGEPLALEDDDRAHVYFPVTMVSCLRLRSRHSGVGLVGREGVIGWPAMLGFGPCEYEASVLMDGGAAFCAPVDSLREIWTARPRLLLHLLHYVQAYTFQLSCSLRASNCATLKQRLSASLLMLHDRIDGNLIPITHDSLASLLAVRRASITDGLHMLEGDMALVCKRGLIQIRERSKLERTAGIAYAGPCRPYGERPAASALHAVMNFALSGSGDVGEFAFDEGSEEGVTDEPSVLVG